MMYGMVPEISGLASRVFCHFGLFSANLKNQNFEKQKQKQKKAWKYYYFTLVYHKQQSYNAWSLRYVAR